VDPAEAARYILRCSHGLKGRGWSFPEARAALLEACPACPAGTDIFIEKWPPGGWLESPSPSDGAPAETAGPADESPEQETLRQRLAAIRAEAEALRHAILDGRESPFTIGCEHGCVGSGGSLFDAISGLLDECSECKLYQARRAESDAADEDAPAEPQQAEQQLYAALREAVATINAAAANGEVPKFYTEPLLAQLRKFSTEFRLSRERAGSSEGAEPVAQPPAEPPPPLSPAAQRRAEMGLLIEAMELLDGRLAAFEARLRRGRAYRDDYRDGLYFAGQLGAHVAELKTLASDHDAIDDRDHRERMASWELKAAIRRAQQ
jgi:hypothetical protein